MNKIIPLFAFGLIFSSVVSSNEELDSCETVAACFEKAGKIAEPPESGIIDVSTAEWAVAKKLASFGEKAVPEIVAALKHPREDIAQIAAAALRDADNIDEKYLPGIIQALDSEYDLGWLPPALGRIKSPVAAKEAVDRFVGSYSAPHNQEAYAVRLHGARAIPFIIERALCPKPCGRDDHYDLGYVLGEMSTETREQAALAIREKLTESDLSNHQQESLVYLLGFLKDGAKSLESFLLALRVKNSELVNVINRALIEMRSHHAAEIFAYELSINPDDMILHKLARMGRAGNGAGNIVLQLTNHEHWSIRQAATTTLGFIGYQEAVPKLIALLADPANIRINWAAAQSLGMLRDEISIPALQKAANNHWFPGVRVAAKRALKNMETGIEYDSENEDEIRLDILNVFSQTDISACKKIRLEAIEEDRALKLYPKYAKEKLKALAHGAVVIGVGASDEAEQRAEDPNAIVEVRADNMVEYRTPIKQVPDMAIRTERGWLAGSSRGEWGGELVFIKAGTKPQLIMKENIEDIYKLGDRYITVTGLAHLGMNRGNIFELIEDTQGWFARPWRALPGAPQTSWFVETGEILINTYSGGSVLIKADGTMRMAECL
ncbi:MAG: HEAT repeat domain-containing protein [Cellvibrionaceae bacterium]